MIRTLCHTLLFLLVASSSVLGCSDTECHDRLKAGGGVETSPMCDLSAAVEPDGSVPDVTVADVGSDLQELPDGQVAPDVAPGEDVATPDVVEEVAEDENALEGQWLSAGSDLAPLLAEGGFEITAISVSFASDGTYRGTIVLAAGDELPYGGTYTVDDGQAPWPIQLNQTAPQSLVSAGLIEVAGDTMRLEVVQVDPPTPGFQPPSGSFGTTVGIDDPDDNIQVYRRQ
jgi:hypothetical protein